MLPRKRRFLEGRGRMTRLRVEKQSDWRDSDSREFSNLEKKVGGGVGRASEKREPALGGRRVVCRKKKAWRDQGGKGERWENSERKKRKESLPVAGGGGRKKHTLPARGVE